MIAENICIKGEERYKEFKSYVEEKLPSASYRNSSTYNTKSDSYEVSIRYNISDALLLEGLFDKWSAEDKLVQREIPKSPIGKLLSRFSFSSS